MGEQHTHVHDVFQACTGRLKDGLAVCQSLARLILDGVACELAAARIYPDGSGDEHERPCFDPLTEERRTRRLVVKTTGI
jgi:hypothetical protein